MLARELGRRRRHRRLRKKVVGLPERPRVSIFRSDKHCYAQLVDDVAGKTLMGWSTKDERLTTSRSKSKGTVEAAKALGVLIAADASKQGIRRVVFDRGGYVFHGRVKAVADAMREGGLEV